ncbi:MAG: riboflavin kinase [Deltaproteobacteria bacterium]|nr:riboflavin kinase [Deltaproteobacteria bacterium]
MQVVRGKEAGSLPPEARVFALGTFDGVHRGHAALLDAARRMADRRAAAGEAATAWALTFHPHPAQSLAPDRAPLCIGDLEDRLDWLARTGIAGTWVVPFDRALAALDPSVFYDTILKAGGARGLVVGHDFTFGKGRAGDGRVLARLGQPEGVEVEVVPPVRTPEGLIVSSTRIRGRIAAGDLAGAREMLGRDVELSSEVRSGAGRGGGLGFATANLLPEGRVVPGQGVYSGWGRIEGEARAYPAAINVGRAPTFGALARAQIEAHLLGHPPGSLAGRRLRLCFLRRLRGERHFPGPEALVAQIQKDVARTEADCARLPPPPWAGEGA